MFTNYDLATLREYIDWTPFFQTWDMAGAYPRILDDEVVGEAARNLFDDAQQMLDEMVEQKLVEARGVIGFWPANSVGDDIQVYRDDDRKDLLTTLYTLRQQVQRRNDRPHLALADYIAPKESGVPDWIGAFAVSTGFGMKELVDKYKAEHDDYRAIMIEALADRLAEAFAEHLHMRVRREFWGYAPNEKLDNTALIREEYQGIRPAPGYPACPDHTEKGTLFNLLGVSENIGIDLTESYAMWPAASVCGLYFSHPDSIYFGVSKVERDQVEDYARRKRMSTEDVERWLSPVLNYTPALIDTDEAA